MKLAHLLLTAGAVVGAAGLLIALPQDDENPMRPEALDVFVGAEGVWDAEVEFHTMEGTMSGTMTYEWHHNGMWLVGEFEGDVSMMGMTLPFTGTNTLGFDGSTDRYTSSWIDSMTPYISISHGEWDAEAKTMTWMGESFDSMARQLHTMKMVHEHVSDDKTVFTMYGIDDEGNEVKESTFVYTRQ